MKIVVYHKGEKKFTICGDKIALGKCLISTDKETKEIIGNVKRCGYYENLWYIVSKFEYIKSNRGRKTNK